MSEHGIAISGNFDTTSNLIRELRDLYTDVGITNKEISALFNREGVGHPYHVVMEGNAKDFCFSMQESMALVKNRKS